MGSLIAGYSDISELLRAPSCGRRLRPGSRNSRLRLQQSGLKELLEVSIPAGATLVSVGAIVGALPIFWTLVPLILALVLIVLSVMYVRRARVRRVSA